MRIELSKRLQAVADMVTPGMRLADVGTDHGYIPIYLVQEGKIPSAIAMDINKGPLEKAKENITEYGLSDKIETRLSDGLAKLKSKEVDTMIAAGMGGNLVIHILSAEELIAKGLKELILQPQSELGKVRAYLRDNGYCVVKEDMVYEDGKYYPIMKVVVGESDSYTEEELQYGKYLLKESHPVLKEFLLWEMEMQQEILDNLKKKESERIRVRCQELEAEIDQMRKILRERYQDDL